MSEVTNSATFLKLKDLIAKAESEDEKSSKGNVAAGTRLRGIMQDVKATANELRGEVLAARKK